MKNVLFLLDELPFTHSANGICVSKIIKALNSDDIGVYCICWNSSEEIPAIVNYIKDKPWKRIVKKWNKTSILHRIVFGLLRFLYRIKRFVFLPIWPVDSISTVISFYIHAKKLIINNNISVVVAVNYPGETVLALKLLKKRFKNRIKTVIYPLDVSLFNPICGKIERKISAFFCPHFFANCGKYADNILFLENAEYIFNRLFSEKNNNKVIYCGIPLLELNTDTIDKSNSNSNELHFLYSGTLNRSVRNPDLIFSFLDDISKIFKDKKIVFDLFGQIDSISINIFSKNNYGFVLNQHGWVKEHELDKEYIKADFLINIGNNDRHLIPSKIFKYLSTGQPIVHLYTSIDDPCIDYLNKYPNSLLLSTDDIYSIMNKLNIYNKCYSFIKNAKQIKIDISEYYPKCTPQFTANLIKQIAED